MTSLAELKVMIVDDEPVNGLILKSIIEEVTGVEAVCLDTSGSPALQQAERYQPQAVFLDIDMPGRNGLDLARDLLAMREDIYIVFATAYPDYALQAFELHSFDYILKPFNAERIKKTVRKLKDKVSRPVLPGTPAAVFHLDSQGRRVVLKPEEILYLESRKTRRVYIKTTKNDYLIRGDLNTLEQKLKPHGFFRSHRAYLVNLHYIKEIIPSGYTFQIVLQSGERILLSRQHEKIITEAIGN